MNQVTLPNISGNFRLTRRFMEMSHYVYKTYKNVEIIKKGGADATHAAERFVHDTSEIGPLVIKMSQFLSARSDVFDEKILNVLGRLQDEVPPDISGPGDVFGYEIWKEPLAAASIATVYKGVRKFDDKNIVLKKVRKDVKRQIIEDLPILIYVLSLAKACGFPGSENMLEIVRECRPMLFAELDLRIEAKNHEDLRRRLSDIEWLTIPKVYEAGETYMISEYVPSKKITSAHPNKILAKRLFELYIKMILDHGLVHADPHAGNIGVRGDGTFVLYDFGAVIDVREAKMMLARVLKSAALEDVDGVVRALEDIGIIKQGGSAARLRKIIPKLRKILESEDFNIELAKIPEFTSNEARIFELQTKYVYLIRSLVIVQGLITYHDADFSLTRYIKKYDELIDDLVEIPTVPIKTTVTMTNTNGFDHKKIEKKIKKDVSKATTIFDKLKKEADERNQIMLDHAKKAFEKIDEIAKSDVKNMQEFHDEHDEDEHIDTDYTEIDDIVVFKEN